MSWFCLLYFFPDKVFPVSFNVLVAKQIFNILLNRVEIFCLFFKFLFDFFPAKEHAA